MKTFVSPSRGRLSLEEVFHEIVAYLEQDPRSPYRIIIGTDSQVREDVCFVTAVIVHRQGKGGRYFYSREHQSIGKSLRQRIFYETSRSLLVAGQLSELFSQNGYADLNVEIHLDVGEQGKTRELIREVVGMVVGSGFDARIKPDSFGASSIADRYTK